MATYDDDKDFYDEEEPELLAQNLTFRERLLHQMRFQNAQQPQSSTTEKGEIPQEDGASQEIPEGCYEVESFIIEMESYPWLWNTSTRSHHDQNMRMNAWEELSKKFGKPG